MTETREPPNKRLRKRLERLREFTASTVSVDYHGGSIFVLTTEDDEFWRDTYRLLDERDYQINKNLGGELFVQKKPRADDGERRRER